MASSIPPDEQTFLSMLKSERRSVGKQVHVHVEVSGLHSSVYLRNSLIKMYLDAGDVEAEEAMFRCTPTADTVSCNIMLSGYVKGGCGGKALRFFCGMVSRGIGYTAVALLACCGRLKKAVLGRSVHGIIVRRIGIVDRGLILSNALLDMYAKCGEMNMAMRVFDEAGKRKTNSGWQEENKLSLSSRRSIAKKKRASSSREDPHRRRFCLRRRRVSHHQHAKPTATGTSGYADPSDRYWTGAIEQASSCGPYKKNRPTKRLHRRPPDNRSGAGGLGFVRKTCPPRQGSRARPHVVSKAKVPVRRCGWTSGAQVPKACVPDVAGGGVGLHCGTGDAGALHGIAPVCASVAPAAAAAAAAS
uniref:Pentatricopeptide repeat-containing protein n=1 Tax=Oryza rufipogon TaxID=4529 RepID=A0A0E0QSQ2_ORYRU